MRALVAAKVFLLAAGLAGTASAGEVTVLASTAIKTALTDLAPQFEKVSEHKVAITYGASGRLQPQIEKGAAFDLAILSNAVADALVKAGKLDPATRIVVARSGAGLAVRQSAPKPDIGSVEAFKRTLLNAKSLGYSEVGATGQFLTTMFQKLGIADEMKPKLRLSTPGVPSMASLANGEVDIVLPQMSEVKLYPGVELVGPLPPELQVYTVLPGAVATSAKESAAARALLKFLTSPAAAKVMKANGLEPG
jgi:molybdate transport system substrate-binding protein